MNTAPRQTQHEQSLAAADHAPTAAPDAWPVFRGDAEFDGVAGCTLPDQPALLWKHSVKDGMFEGTPAIADGVIYIGGLNGYFYALDLATGDEKWKYHSELGFRAPAAVRDGLVYIGDSEGRFVCLDAASGESKWGISTDAEINAGANFYKGNVIIGSQSGTLYCLDAKTGKEAWKYAIDNMIQCSPTIVENRVFLAGCDSVLHIIDIDTGQRVAQVDIGDPTGVTPAAVGDRVYFATQGAKVLCIDWRGQDHLDVRARQTQESLPIVASRRARGCRDWRSGSHGSRSERRKWRRAMDLAHAAQHRFLARDRRRPRVCGGRRWPGLRPESGLGGESMGV